MAARGAKRKGVCSVDDDDASSEPAAARIVVPLPPIAGGAVAAAQGAGRGGVRNVEALLKRLPCPCALRVGLVVVIVSSFLECQMEVVVTARIRCVIR